MNKPFFYPSPASLLLVFLYLFTACSPSRQPENEVRIRFPADPESLNPISYQTVQATQVVNLLFQSLLTVDLADNTLQPLLATRMPEVEKGDSLNRFTYTLRPEATWDDGKPVTAQDVVFSMKVIQCPLVNNERIRPRYEIIRDIALDKDNPRKFTIVCQGYTPEMLLLTGDFFILPEATFDPEGHLSSFSIPQLIGQFDSLAGNERIKSFAERFNSSAFARDGSVLKGSGGYLLKEWKTGQYLQLEKKPGWWAEKLGVGYLTARPDRIRAAIIPDNTTALQQMKSGQLDVLDNIGVNDFNQLKKDATITASFNLLTPDTYDVTMMGLNARSEKLADRRTRQALAHLLDVDAIIGATQNGYAIPAVGMISPKDSLNFHRKLRPYSYDPDRAVQLLKEAGWQQVNGRWEKEIRENRIPLALQLSYRTGNAALENLGTIFQQAAGKVGIPVELIPMEGRLLLEKRKNHDFELYLRILGGNPLTTNFNPLFHTENAIPNGGNDTDFGTAESDSLIDAINQTEDRSRKAAMLQRFQEIMHEEANVLFLYVSKERLAVSKRFTNLKVSGLMPGYDVSAFQLKND
jgi:peptide/nickel transport system substrate-binding protein